MANSEAIVIMSKVPGVQTESAPTSATEHTPSQPAQLWAATLGDEVQSLLAEWRRLREADDLLFGIACP